ncbi:MAG: MBL fold metallo-hydrolase [bacterium]|nr:MBL fold metallo-hydrolase [bacterium]
MNQVIMLPMEFSADAVRCTIYPVVLKDEEGLTLIDCGYPGFFEKIEEALVQEKLSIKQVKRILITHHDHDHIGALKEITDRYPDIVVYCSKEQAPYITGKEKSLRLIQAESRNVDEGFLDMLKSVEYIDHVECLEDGDVLPICGGVKVIDTSGHMPGHLSFYVEETKTLISGDALTCEKGVLRIADPFFVLDEEQEIESLKKLLSYDIRDVICYHGGRYVSVTIHNKIEKMIKKGYVKERMS